jgi:hypothetical protein
MQTGKTSQAGKTMPLLHKLLAKIALLAKLAPYSCRRLERGSPPKKLSRARNQP